MWISLFLSRAQPGCPHCIGLCGFQSAQPSFLLAACCGVVSKHVPEEKCGPSALVRGSPTVDSAQKCGRRRDAPG
ncbi:hypothetical protein V5799_019809 [Amblyomma americanum]|uniref:Uncharacterized protein n=1 Tax=Amblyomma americanum TaxID=6943 RepID=A0AAQ4EVN9_AMBAM